MAELGEAVYPVVRIPVEMEGGVKMLLDTNRVINMEELSLLAKAA